jgi:hypothetical protein
MLRASIKILFHQTFDHRSVLSPRVSHKRKIKKIKTLRGAKVVKSVADTTNYPSQFESEKK